MNRSTCIFLAVVAAVVLSCPVAAHATLPTLQFEYGDSDAYVDAFRGMIGEGWQSIWERSRRNLDLDQSVEGVINTSELKTGWGNYLNLHAVANEDTTDVRLAECRNYVGDLAYFDPTKAHTIQFSVRINELISDDGLECTFHNWDDDFYLIEDHPTIFSNTTGNMRWGIRVDGGDGTYGSIGKEWHFIGGDHTGAYMGSGTAEGSTGITLETGVVYDFTVEVDPTLNGGSWVGTVVKNGGEAPYTYTSDAMGWRDDLNTPGGWLVFASRGNDDTDVRDWSIDNIIITQESVLIPGDTEPDNDVDADDLAVVAGNWGSTGLTPYDYTVGNFNDDDVCDALDAAIQAANWTGPGESNGGTTVPEPSAAVLLLGTLASLLVWRRR